MKEKSPARIATENILRDRQIAYRSLFGSPTPASKTVLADLEKFCRAKSTTFHLDSRLHALLEGRREVVLRVNDYLNLTVDELFVKYGGREANAE